MLPFAFFCLPDRLAMGQQETAPRDLLAVRLHLDNGTALPTAAVQLRWQVGVSPWGGGGWDTSPVPPEPGILPIPCRC